MNYEVVIGIEIHLELKTLTKMFSGAPVLTGKEPNTCASAIDIALPGTLPSVNKQAVRMALMACKALNCEIDELVRFDRKNYYYSDLPKGYQITQQFHPLGKKGFIEINVNGENKKIRINRIHMEEDTAKQFHLVDGTYIDYNRAGTPLIEIVSEADMSGALEAMAYVEKIRAIMYYLGVSDCKMEEGSLRCDVNISLRPYGFEGFGRKVEIKNLNSIANVAKAIDAEIKRQSRELDLGNEIVQATYRYDDASRQTIMMRKKEGNVDYKYFPEPNIPIIRLSKDFISSAIDNLAELPDERMKRYQTLGLNEYDSSLLVNNKELGDYFDLAIVTCGDYKGICNWLTGEFSAYLTKNQLSIHDSKIEPSSIAELVDLINTGEISSRQAKDVFKEMIDGFKPKDIVERQGLKQVSDDSIITKIIEEVLAANEQSISDYRQGKDRALGFLVGQVMKQSKGQVNPAKASELLKAALDKEQ